MKLQEIIPTSIQDRGRLLAYMANRLEKFYAIDLQGFIQLMYQLDIPEPTFSRDTLSFRELAEVILTRQLQKIQTRKANPPSTDEDDELRW